MSNTRPGGQMWLAKWFHVTREAILETQGGAERPQGKPAPTPPRLGWAGQGRAVGPPRPAPEEEEEGAARPDGGAAAASGGAAAVLRAEPGGQRRRAAPCPDPAGHHPAHPQSRSGLRCHWVGDAPPSSVAAEGDGQRCVPSKAEATPPLGKAANGPAVPDIRTASTRRFPPSLCPDGYQETGRKSWPCPGGGKTLEPSSAQLSRRERLFEAGPKDPPESAGRCQRGARASLGHQTRWTTTTVQHSHGGRGSARSRMPVPGQPAGYGGSPCLGGRAGGSPCAHSPDGGSSLGCQRPDVLAGGADAGRALHPSAPEVPTRAESLLDDRRRGGARDGGHRHETPLLLASPTGQALTAATSAATDAPAARLLQRRRQLLRVTDGLARPGLPGGTASPEPTSQGGSGLTLCLLFFLLNKIYFPTYSCPQHRPPVLRPLLHGTGFKLPRPQLANHVLICCVES